MAKRRTIVDDLRDIRQALGSLPPENARALLRDLTPPTTTQVQMRATADEKKRWKAAAAKTDKSLSDWLRDLANAAAKGA